MSIGCSTFVDLKSADYLNFDKCVPFCEDAKLYNLFFENGHFVARPKYKKRDAEFDKVSTKGIAFDRNRDLDSLIDRICYDGLKQGFRIKGKKLDSFVENSLCLDSDFADNIEEYIEKRVKEFKHNLHNKFKRLTKKAMLTDWNYFTTYTYSDDLHTEASFEQKLRKCLSNLCSRRGWRYMLVFERGTETNRLHVHAIMYIPQGEMIGKIEEVKDFDKHNKKMQITHQNTFFAKIFGKNDFSPICQQDLITGKTLDYLLKYIYKDNGRVIYSRRIPTEILLHIKFTDFCCKMSGLVNRYILHDNVIDWDVDIYKYKQEQLSFF